MTSGEFHIDMNSIPFVVLITFNKIAISSSVSLEIKGFALNLKSMRLIRLNVETRKFNLNSR